MNEITKIHLGRQAFNISVTAYRALQQYLAAIGRQADASGEDVIKEVELRMAELLAEHGVKDDQVILDADIDFLKEQLGKPADFKEDTDNDTVSQDERTTKRLFRDTEHGMIAGVSAGLANYLGIPAIIIRVLFIIATVSGGVGILIYVLLWLLIPEATSPRAQLQMHGKAITIESLKQTIERADVPGAMQRSGSIIKFLAERVAAILLTIVGVAFIIASLALLAAAAVATSYLLIRGLQVANKSIFPVGVEEVTLVIIALVTALLGALALAVVGRAMVRRKWSVPAWATAAAITSFVVVASVGAAISFDRLPVVRERYQRTEHREVRTEPAFRSVNIDPAISSTTVVNYDVPAPEYSVEIMTRGDLSPRTIEAVVHDSVLQISATKQFSPHISCRLFCPFGESYAQIIIHAPASFQIPPDMSQVTPATPFMAPTIPPSNTTLQ